MTTTQDEKALLRAIFENPDDDAPRLIYADCIQELGRDAEAERIRDAVANPDRTSQVIIPLPSSRKRRLSELWESPSNQMFNVINGYFNRGFLDAITVDHDDFMNNFEVLFKNYPIRKVRIIDRRPYQNAWFCDRQIPLDVHPEIHEAIFDHLPLKKNRHPSFEYYGPEFDLYDILSQGCVALARYSVMLPMMPNYRRKR